ncbi:MAG: metallophosphoesterase [Planctomycetes bacterium]|nr:metallophosphoesterase [Planctomycetota bacterium]
MKIFATADIHGNKSLIYLIREMIKKEEIDLLVIAGDIAPKGFYQLYRNGLKYDIRSAFCLRNRGIILDGNEQQIRTKLDLLGFVEISRDNYNLSLIRLRQKEALRRICELLKTLRIPVYLLIGNDDHISDNDWDKILSDYGIYNLNLKAYELEEFKMVGFQYVLPTPWNTNNELPEDRLADELTHIEPYIDRKTILITHGPPKNILDRTGNGLRVGSESIYRTVKEKQPMFHVFGHIHEAFGKATIDNITFYNVASLWDDWLLRGYIIDTKTMNEKRIERRILLGEFKHFYDG